MDDYLDSAESVDVILERCESLVRVLKQGGFKLTKFVSNVPTIGLKLNDDEKKKTPPILVNFYCKPLHHLPLMCLVSNGIITQIVSLSVEECARRMTTTSHNA